MGHFGNLVFLFSVISGKKYYNYDVYDISNISTKDGQ